MSDEKQESLNELTNGWNNIRIKDTSQDPDIWFHELFDSNLRFKNIEVKYAKEKYELIAHVFDVLPENYNTMRVSCSIKVSKMEFKDTKKEINWF